MFVFSMAIYVVSVQPLCLHLLRSEEYSLLAVLGDPKVVRSLCIENRCILSYWIRINPWSQSFFSFPIIYLVAVYFIFYLSY